MLDRLTPKLRFTSLAIACALASALLTNCGTGSSGTIPVSTTPKPTLVAIALSPLTVTLAPATTQQLAVIGTYSDGSKPTLTTGETFASSNTAIATVSTLGLVTAVVGAPAGSSATIAATDTASGITTSSSSSTVITISLGPSLYSVSAATTTAQSNALCTAVQPFYWEIGNQTSGLASGSVGTLSTGAPVLASTKFSIASASKWIYGTYIVQQRGSAAAITLSDIPFLNFTSGYTNMGDPTTNQCLATNSPDDVNNCLAQTNSNNGLPYSYQNPATVGKFDYDGGHLENHASQLGGLGTVPDTSLGTTVGTLVGSSTLVYTEPLLPGGIYASSNDYTPVLRGILSGALYMHDALGTNAVCTRPSSTCNAVSSPIPEAWHYSMAHWVEDDPSTNGDGAFSSAGAFGFYPWIEAGKKYYGVISTQQSSGSGYASAQCGRLIRRAWDTGIVQTGTIPTP